MLSQPFPNTLLIDLLVVQEEREFAISLVLSPLAEQVIRNVMHIITHMSSSLDFELLHHRPLLRIGWLQCPPRPTGGIQRVLGWNEC